MVGMWLARKAAELLDEEDDSDSQAEQVRARRPGWWQHVEHLPRAQGEIKIKTSPCRACANSTTHSGSLQNGESLISEISKLGGQIMTEGTSFLSEMNDTVFK